MDNYKIEYKEIFLNLELFNFLTFERASQRLEAYREMDNGHASQWTQ